MPYDVVGALPHHEVLALPHAPAGGGEVVGLRLGVGVDVGVAHREVVEVYGADAVHLRRPLPEALGAPGGVAAVGGAAAEVVLSRIHGRCLLSGKHDFMRSRLLLLGRSAAAGKHQGGKCRECRQ